MGYSSRTWLFVADTYMNHLQRMSGVPLDIVERKYPSSLVMKLNKNSYNVYVLFPVAFMLTTGCQKCE